MRRASFVLYKDERNEPEVVEARSVRNVEISSIWRTICKPCKPIVSQMMQENMQNYEPKQKCLGSNIKENSLINKFSKIHGIERLRMAIITDAEMLAQQRNEETTKL